MKQIFMTLTVMLFTTTAMMAQKLYITVGGVTKTATLASNSATQALSNATAIGQVRADDSEARAYTLHGTWAQAGHKGIVIRNGKVAHARTKFRRR